MAAVQRERLGRDMPAIAGLLQDELGVLRPCAQALPRGSACCGRAKGARPVRCGCVLRRVWFSLCRVTYEGIQMQTTVKANAGGNVAFDETLSFAKYQDRNIIKARLRPCVQNLCVQNLCECLCLLASPCVDVTIGTSVHVDPGCIRLAVRRGAFAYR